MFRQWPRLPIDFVFPTHEVMGTLRPVDSYVADLITALRKAFKEVCNMGKILNKAPVVPNKSDKTLNGSVHGGFRVFCDGLQVISAWPYPLQETLCPKYSIFSLKFTFGRLKFQSVESKVFQQCL